jgi:hypothetical protein
VVRIRVDPAGQLTGAQLADGIVNLRDLATPAGIDVLENNLAAMPAGRREVEMLMVGRGPEDLKATAVALCAKAFGTDPGDIERVTGDDGLDVIHVTLRKIDLERIPESRIHTALEASLNCEVHIRTT